MSSQTAISPIAHPTPRRLQGGRVGSLEYALLFIAVFALVIGVVAIAVAAQPPGNLVAIVQYVVLFWIWVAAGICAWWRRPMNGIGGLLLVGSLALILGSAGYFGVPGLYAIGAVFSSSALSVAVHLLLAFPSGRIRDRLSLITVVLGYITSLFFDLIRAVVFGTPAFAPVSFVQSTIGVTVMIMTAVVLVRRLKAADAAHRRILLPLFTYGILAIPALPMIPNVLLPLGVDPELVTWMQGVLLAGLPIAFLLGVLRGGFTRTTPLEALSEWLALRGASRPAAARALATTLGDSTLRVVYWDAAHARFVDERGLEVRNRTGDAGRGWLQVLVDDDLVGAIDYDAGMIAEPSPVRRAAEVLAIAIDRERLTVQLLTSNEALLLSRARIVEAGDRERFRIARDLHDGLQTQLVLLAIEAQTIANAPSGSDAAGPAEALRRGIDTAAADLRRLVHDVLPAALLEQGFVAAVEDLVDRLPVAATFRAEVDEPTVARPTAHTAYFIVAEALSNAVKHARATTVRVTMTQTDGRLALEIEDDGIGGARINAGMGLRGLADRVDALGGRIEIRSERNRGTNVRVELPCAL